MAVPPLSVRVRLNAETLFAAEGATHVMVMAVLSTSATLTDVGGSGWGGAVCEKKE
jgi:hypothetical protein